VAGADATKLPEAPYNQLIKPRPYNPLPRLPLLPDTPSHTFKMDTLVAQYSKPMFEKEDYSQDDQMELYQSAPSLSLKFAMPPVAQVCLPSVPSDLFQLCELVLSIC
jgi:hypothetical protein